MALLKHASSCLCHLGGYVVGHIVGAEGAARIVGFTKEHFTAHNRKLRQALAHSHERAWKALAVALAGDSLIDKGKRLFASGDDKDFREHVHAFLERAPLPGAATSIQFRQACLAEYKGLSGHLTPAADAVDVADLGHAAQKLREFADTQGQLQAAWQAVEAVANGLAADCPNLAQLLRMRTPESPPMLVSAFAFFFRRQVERDEELAHGLFFDSLRRLTAAQATGFAKVDLVMNRMDEALEALGRLESLAGENRETSREILERLKQLQAEIRESANRNHVHPGEVSARFVVSINSAKEQELLRRLRDAYRKLPPAMQEADDWMLLADALSAARQFGMAREGHEAAARAAEGAKNRTQQAEALYKAYRNACEESKWDAALSSLLRAADLEPARFEPFPLRRYKPQRILGAGGFGVVFLCEDDLGKVDVKTGKKPLVAIKSLYTADLARNVEEIFTEAHTLQGLRHDGIIGVRHWDHADQTTKSRPYIVMDYFPAPSLQDHLKRHGKLAPADALAVARQAAAALKAAHEHDVWHRDLKPDNFLALKDDGWKVKLIDFGLAVRQQVVGTSVAHPPNQRTTQDNSFAGTYKYSSPEAKGELPGVAPGPLSDVYTFGKTICEALFGTTEPRSFNIKQLPQEYQPLGELLERCIATPVEERPAGGFKEVLAQLEALAARTASPKPRQQAEARTQPKRERQPGEIITNKLGMPFAWIPPTSWYEEHFKRQFLMGSPPNEAERSDDETQHRVTLTKGFFMGVHPVTRGQFAQFVQATGFKTEAERDSDAQSWRSPGFDQSDEHPVVSVSWNDVKSFCEWLKQQEGKPYRLPTEAEWEYACRAGTITPFYFGATISTEQANYDGNYTYGSGTKGKYRQRTLPVGHFPPNDWGLYDMHGQVWEWCSDWYEEYPNKHLTDPQGPTNASVRVVRGGSWNGTPRYCRAARRFRNAPGIRIHCGGCRLVFCLD